MGSEMCIRDSFYIGQKFPAMCKRDNTNFMAEVRGYPLHDTTLEPDDPTATHYAWPTRKVSCPTCGRQYFLNRDGVFESDRELIILDPVLSQTVWEPTLAKKGIIGERPKPTSIS